MRASDAARGVAEAEGKARALRKAVKEQGRRPGWHEAREDTEEGQEYKRSEEERELDAAEEAARQVSPFLILSQLTSF